MSKSTRKLIQTCKLICTILLVVIVGLQFIPYWYGVYTKTSSELLTEEEYMARLEEQNKATEPEATEPEATEPEATEPEVTEPEVTEPADDEATEPSEEETTAPSLDLGIDFYDPSTAPVDEPVLTKYSIATYIWTFKQNLKNDVIYMPVLMLLFAVASIATYVKNTYSTMCSIFAVVAPAVGLIGFLTVPLYATGFQWVYILHIIANAITLIVTLGTLILRLVVFIKQVRKDRAERIAKSSFAKK